ncbi:aspartyl protease family protein, partial [Staphylococcus aureus]
MVKFGDKELRMQLDSGADVTVISPKAWTKIGAPELRKSDMKLGAANGTQIEVMGEFDVKFSCAGYNGVGRCYVAKKMGQLMGMEWMEQLPPMT